MEFLHSKLQTYKLQPSILRVFKIQDIHKITSTVTFFFVEAGANRFTTEQKFLNTQKQLFVDVLQSRCS